MDSPSRPLVHKLQKIFDTHYLDEGRKLSVEIYMDVLRRIKRGESDSLIMYHAHLSMRALTTLLAQKLIMEKDGKTRHETVENGEYKTNHLKFLIEQAMISEKYDEVALGYLIASITIMKEQEKISMGKFLPSQKLDTLVHEANKICQCGEKLKLEKKGEKEKYTFLFMKNRYNT